MNHRGLLITALALVTVGLIGLTITSAFFFLADSGARTATTPQWRQWPLQQDGQDTGYASVGERIYYTGIGREGPIAREWSPPGGMMGRSRRRAMGPACVTCHRRDGRGGALGMMGSGIEAPDIRYRTLAAPHEEDGETSAAWTDDDIARAIRDGVEPSGERLDQVMPRWEMSEGDMDDLIEYLKEL